MSTSSKIVQFQQYVSPARLISKSAFRPRQMGRLEMVKKARHKTPKAMLIQPSYFVSMPVPFAVTAMSLCFFGSSHSFRHAMLHQPKNPHHGGWGYSQIKESKLAWGTAILIYEPTRQITPKDSP